MKKIIILFFITIALIAKGQHSLPIDEKGRTLRNFYLSMDVEQLWLAGHHINWETGEPDRPNAEHGIKTHCSAFVAAACKRINIYVLRPPEHAQLLLSNAQYDWFTSRQAIDDGWKQLTENNTYSAAQEYANKGYVVAATCKNPNPHLPGHIALVMPSEISKPELEDSGPVIIMAGNHNHNSISFRAGFKSHISSWPDHDILFYYNTNLPAINASVKADKMQ